MDTEDDYEFISPIYIDCECYNRPIYIGEKQLVLTDISKMIEENIKSMSMFNILTELYPEYHANYNYSASKANAYTKNNHPNN